MTADPRASAPPYDEHAEAALLGAMMVTREAIRAAHAQQITAADFYVDNHKRFWTAITAVDATGAFPDPITVAAALNGTAETDRPCLIRLQATTPASSNAHAYAAVVADRARRRRLLAVSNELANAARAGTDTTTVLAQVATLTANTDPRARLEPGGQFILDAPRTAAAIWGEDDRVLWAAGESLLIVGPPGVGKTTLTIQLVAGRLGIIDRLLGLPIVASHRILYLACDRPAQIQRAMRRVFTEEHRELLEERLAIWQGPPARTRSSSTRSKTSRPASRKTKSAPRSTSPSKPRPPKTSTSSRSTTNAKNKPAPNRPPSKTSTGPAGSPPAPEASSSSGATPATPSSSSATSNSPPNRSGQ
jgi:replicative DNA helicase